MGKGKKNKRIGSTRNQCGNTKFISSNNKSNDKNVKMEVGSIRNQCGNTKFISSNNKSNDKNVKMEVSSIPAKVSSISNKKVIPIRPTSLPVPSTQVRVPSGYNKKVIPISPTNLPVPSKQARVPSSYNKKQISTSLISIPFNKKPPSLTNNNATCYLNSAFQGISSCNKLVKAINVLHKSLPDLEKLKLFNNLISILNGNEGNRMELSRNEIFRNWNKPGQQDSFELLSYVMNQVYNEIRNKKKSSTEEWLNYALPLKLIVKNRICCGCSKELETPLQTDIALHVPISFNSKLNLQQLVDDFFKEETIEDYSCESQCGNNGEATRSTLLCKPLPETICIHLQRTYWNGNQMVKKRKKITFTKKIAIKSKFCCDQILSTQNENDQIEKDNTNSDPSYQLVSVIDHSGFVDGGHYICYKRVDDQWFRTDDAHISKVKEIEVFRCEAYILFYESDN